MANNAPMPNLAAAIKQAEESLALFDSPCTPLPHEVYQDRAMDALRLILAAAKATSAPVPCPHCKITEAPRGWTMQRCPAHLTSEVVVTLRHPSSHALRRCEVRGE